MKKILRLQSALLKEIDKYEKLVPKRSHFIDWERVHITSRQEGHAEAGYLPVQEFLKNLEPKLFTDDEIAQIALAVKNHSKKGEVGTKLEEIVKDADVLDFYQYGYNMARKEQQDRLESLLGHKVEGLKFSEK